MKFIWATYGALFALGAASHYVLGMHNSLPFFLFLTHCFCVYLYLLLSRDLSAPVKTLLLVGFALRVAALLYDVYADAPFLMLNVSSDAEYFYEAAMGFSQEPSLLFDGESFPRAGMFGKFLGVFMIIEGPHRLWAQYLSTVCGISLVIVLKKAMDVVDIRPRIQVVVVGIAVFFFTSVMKSATLQREMHPAFLTAVSVLMFLLWLLDGKTRYAVAALVFLLGASFFHAGVIGLAMGYTFGFCFYRHETGKFSFTVRSVAVMALIVIGSIVLNNYAGDVFFNKFTSVEEVEDIYSRASWFGKGGAAYNVGVTIDTPLGLFFGGILRTFYFLFSPLPWYWRGMMDALSFLLDSSLYLFTFGYLILRRKKIFDGSKESRWILIITIGLLAASFIFGLGTNNAAPAMRHRQKLVAAFLLVFSMAMNKVSLAKKRLTTPKLSE